MVWTDRDATRGPHLAVRAPRGDDSDRDDDLSDRADRRDDLGVHRLRLGCQRAQRPLAVAGEEPEVTAGRGRDLGGELTGAVEQAHVRRTDRLAAAQHLALDDCLILDVDAVEGQPALSGAAHQASPGSSPRATGTPTREPYSVHEPS